MTETTKPEQQKRVVWAFVGEYASGKSENAVNAALHLLRQGRQVTLVDFDMVEPCYTLRPLREPLTKLGLNVLAWSTSETTGLGEAGQTVLPASRWALRQPGDVIFDVGYGISGSSSLNLVEGAWENQDLQIVLVLNACRPMTANPDLMEEYLDEIGRVDAVVANTHLAEETTPQIVTDGYRMVETLCARRGLPILYAAVDQLFQKTYPDFVLTGSDGRPVEMRVLERYMPNSFW